MKRRGDSHEVLNHLFARSPVADLSMLKEALGTTSRTSVFRALAAAGYYASYSHTGRYYTIERIPEFNEDGIWAHDSVLFSRLRTLRATIIPMVADAPSGQTHSELEARVHLRVYDTLHDLVAEGRIGRVEFERLYLVSVHPPWRVEYMCLRNILHISGWLTSFSLGVRTRGADAATPRWQVYAQTSVSTGPRSDASTRWGGRQLPDAGTG